MNCTRDKTQIRVSYPTLSLDFFIQVASDKPHRGNLSLKYHKEGQQIKQTKGKQIKATKGKERLREGKGMG
jgi:hypothetical protein